MCLSLKTRHGYYDYLIHKYNVAIDEGFHSYTKKDLGYSGYPEYKIL